MEVVKAVKVKIPGVPHRIAKIEAAKRGLTLQEFLSKIIEEAADDSHISEIERRSAAAQLDQ